MPNENSHPTHEELLQTADGELSARLTKRVRDHLAACWECRARMAEIDATIVDFVKIHRQTLDPQLPSSAGPSALLRARLGDVASRSLIKPERASFRMTSPKPLALFLCSMLLVSAVLWQYIARRPAPVKTNSFAIAYEPGTIPDRGLTPGAIRTIAVSEVCSMAHEEVVAQVSSQLQLQVLREYGIANSHPHDYEIDYLVAPGLGGAEDIHNL